MVLLVLVFTLCSLLLMGFENIRFNRLFYIYPDDERANACIRFMAKSRKTYQQWVEGNGGKRFVELENLFLLVEYLVFEPIQKRDYEMLYRVKPILNRYVEYAREVSLMWEVLMERRDSKDQSLKMVVNRSRYVLNEICNNMIERVDDPKLIGFPLKETIA